MNGNKFSVVIPTMWYSDRIHTTLSNLEDCEWVGEILLIDNNTSLKPLKMDFSKVVYLPQKENIYVNPAWNMGVELAKWNNVCIANDDVLFPTDIFEWIQPHLWKGIFGMSTGNYYRVGIEYGYSINPISQRCWGWGCLLFLDKRGWKPIDERLKIACGDDWLLHHMGGWEIKGLDLVNEEISKTTLRGEFFGIQKEDIELWSQYLHSHTKEVNS